MSYFFFRFSHCHPQIQELVPNISETQRKKPKIPHLEFGRGYVLWNMFFQFWVLFVLERKTIENMFSKGTFLSQKTKFRVRMISCRGKTKSCGVDLLPDWLPGMEILNRCVLQYMCERNNQIPDTL